MMQIIRFALLALTALGICPSLPCAAQVGQAKAPQPQSQTQVIKFLSIYRYHRSRLEYPEAIAAISSAIALSPNDADLYEQREELYATTFVLDKALADINKAIALRPNNAGYFRRRARAYYSNGDYAKSVADFTTCIQLDPHNVEQYLARARGYRKLQKYDLAVNDYKTYSTFKKAHRLQDGCNELGEIYLKIGKPNEAVETFTKLIAEFPDLPQGYYGRAKAYDSLGKTKLATVDRAKAQEVERNY